MTGQLCFVHNTAALWLIRTRLTSCFCTLFTSCDWGKNNQKAQKRKYSDSSCSLIVVCFISRLAQKKRCNVNVFGNVRCSLSVTNCSSGYS